MIPNVVLVDLVLLVNKFFMDKKDVQVGNIVRFKNNINDNIYVITSTIAYVKIDNKWIDIIVYAHCYKQDYKLFARPIDDFIQCFELVK